MTATPYEVLGIPPAATKDEIKAAYRRRAKETHPDHGGNDALFQVVQFAYEELKKGGWRWRDPRGPTMRSGGGERRGFDPGTTYRPSPDDIFAQRDFQDIIDSVFGGTPSYRCRNRRCARTLSNTQIMHGVRFCSMECERENLHRTPAFRVTNVDVDVPPGFEAANVKEVAIKLDRDDPSKLCIELSWQSDHDCRGRRGV